MTLGEKIQYYRKKNKLSQEELAARVGVSRQAVSKWELDDTTPEVDKLLALARAFGVTADELLSPEEPKEAPPPPEPEPACGRRRGPGGIERLIRRYGWLAGIYIALSGTGIAAVGLLGKALCRQMFSDGFYELFGDTYGFSDPAAPFRTITTFALTAGIVIALAGVILAVVLWRRGRKKD